MLIRQTEKSVPRISVSLSKVCGSVVQLGVEAPDQVRILGREILGKEILSKEILSKENMGKDLGADGLHEKASSSHNEATGASFSLHVVLHQKLGDEDQAH